MKRETRIPGCLIALTVAVAACGNSFTAADDAGMPPGIDGSFDGSFDASVDTGVADANGMDAVAPPDVQSRDAPADVGGGQGDGSGLPPILGSDGSALDASLCAKTCPSGFDCIAASCVDRAADHFGAVSTTDNWSYGSFMSFGSTTFIGYTASWTTNGIVFASQTKNVLTSSVFHSITSASYEGMTIPAGTLGLYPGTTTSIDSVVRWTAPADGVYAISATFTGLGTAPPTTVGVTVNVGLGEEFSNTIDGTTPSTTYTNAAQSMIAGDTLDFYVNFVTLSEDEQGGTGLDARITAN
jgi:hypothetical protein